ncbi:MAG: DNA cytosine methyltransferase [Amphiplicatus sp.]
MKSFLEFFAGGGLARLGLGAGWRAVLANDKDPMKCAAYRANFGGEALIEGDIAALTAADIPRADLAWASFPCQDLSLAGARAGLKGARSGLFFAFWRLLEALGEERRPPVVVIENVVGLLTSNKGADFRAIVEAMARAGCRVSALVVNAKHFTPQSRPRLFIFGFGAGSSPLFAPRPKASETTPQALLDAADLLPASCAAAWRWLGARPETRRNTRLADLVDLETPAWRADLGEAALSMMSARQRAAVDALLLKGGRHVGAAFRRIRTENGRRAQRLEARFDGLAGCLRTPAGGSSRQMLLLIDGGEVKARLLSPREAARLMGLPDDYVLPARASAALKLCGDGVAAPVVRWIAEAVIEPALAKKAEAA